MRDNSEVKLAPIIVDIKLFSSLCLLCLILFSGIRAVIIMSSSWSKVSEREKRDVSAKGSN